MASYVEYLKAARKADAAGDTEAATTLMKAARAAETMRLEAGGDPRADHEAIFGPNGPSAKPVDRFGDTFAAVTEGPAAATKAFARGMVDPSVSPTRERLPQSLQRFSPVTDAAMTGLSAVGTAIAGGAGVAGEVLAPLNMQGGGPQNEMRLANDLMTMAMVAVPELAGVSSTARSAVRGASAAERMSRPATDAQRGARAADDLGITPSAGMTGKTQAQAVAVLEKIPGANKTVGRDAARAVSEVEDAFSRVVASVGESQSARGAGDVLQTGLSQFRDNFKTQSSKMYGNVAEHLPDGHKVEIPNTISAINEAKAALADNPALAQKLGVSQWDTIIAEAQANGMSWRGLSDFRTTVGDALGSKSGALSDQSTGRLKRLYATLTDDMEAAAKAEGGDAYKAWQRANAYYRAGSDRIRRQLDKTITADSPERAFEAFKNMATDGRATSDINRMRAIKGSLKPGEWDDVAASIVGRLGQKGDDFSPSKFLTEWGKFSPEAKGLLLSRSARAEMDKLAAVAERVKAADAERNFSNTGTIGVGLVAAGGVSYAPKTVLAVLAAANVSAAFLTRPSALRAMNKWARGDARQLKAIANSRDAFAADAATILRLTAAETAAAAANSNSGPQPAAIAR